MRGQISCQVMFPRPDRDDLWTNNNALASYSPEMQKKSGTILKMNVSLHIMLIKYHNGCF